MAEKTETSNAENDSRVDTDKNDFEELANQKASGFLTEFVEFLVDNKKWWLIPIIVALLGLGVLVLVGGSAAAPFIYTLF